MHEKSVINGIGTTKPGYKLDVQDGDINDSGSFRSAGKSNIYSGQIGVSLAKL